MKIVSIIAIADFDKKILESCLNDNSKKCDEMYLRFDIKNGSKSIFNFIEKNGGKITDNKIKHIIKSNNGWERVTTWREELLRCLDNVKPDIVLAPDQDETFENSVKEEIIDFYKGNKNAMYFLYKRPMPTDDGTILLNGYVYPLWPHMKIFRWKPNISYLAYSGYARIKQYIAGNKISYDIASGKHYLAKSRIIHWCLYTKEMRLKKMDPSYYNSGGMTNRSLTGKRIRKLQAIEEMFNKQAK